MRSSPRFNVTSSKPRTSSPAAELVVPGDARGQRIDRWLAALPDADTRSQVAHAIADGRVRVDGQVVKASFKLRGGERVEVTKAPRTPATEIAPESIDLEILYAD